MQVNTGPSNLKMKKLASTVNNVLSQRLVEPNIPAKYLNIDQELSKDFLITTISNVPGQRVVVYYKGLREILKKMFEKKE